MQIMVSPYSYCEKIPGQEGCPHAQVYENHRLIRQMHRLGEFCRDWFAAWGVFQGSRHNFNEGRFLTSVVPSAVCRNCPFRQPHTGGNGNYVFED